MFVLGYLLCGVLFALWMEMRMGTEVAQELIDEGHLPMITNGIRVVLTLVWPYFVVMIVVDLIKEIRK